MMNHEEPCGNIQEKKQGKKRERGNISHVDGCERFDINNDAS
jgi:hypothetical protein